LANFIVRLTSALELSNNNSNNNNNNNNNNDDNNNTGRLAYESTICLIVYVGLSDF